MANVSSHGTRIDFTIMGEGEPALLYLPGWCGSRAMFDATMAAAATARRTMALDWPGHGKSAMPDGDFGAERLVDDAARVIEASGVHTVVPVAASHAGWVAIELARRLGERVPRLVLLDWIVSEAPPPFLEVLRGLQDRERGLATRDQLFTMWLNGSTNAALADYLRRDMGGSPQEMWARAGREIGAAYAREKSPLAALARLSPPVPTLHLYSQPEDPGYLQLQEAYAEEHPFFRVEKMPARSHFPTIELSEDVAARIESFVRGDTHGAHVNADR